MKASQLFDLNGKVAIVTGASRGIGEAIAQVLSDNGAHVVVASRRLERCEEVAADLRAAGGQATALACHVGEMAAIEAFWAAIDARFERVDILVNNAGSNPIFGPVTETDPAAFQKTVDVNFRGYWFMCQYAVARMRRHGGGSIVNMASVTAERPMENIGVYGATKAAVVNLTQAYARECAQYGVRVNAILPGLINTKFAAALQTEGPVRTAALAQIPLRRIGDPIDIAGAALFLASGASSYMTGATLRIDGGLLA
ncbi:MAG: glucose 1-dehydrogenase [Pseudomonadota bacterium]|jgi:NAD(P)-dependent dehydrogenase (short-subunit alcohol dehydrogenase family)